MLRLGRPKRKYVTQEERRAGTERLRSAATARRTIRDAVVVLPLLSSPFVFRDVGAALQQLHRVWSEATSVVLRLEGAGYIQRVTNVFAGARSGRRWEKVQLKTMD